jgi:hypothetical protein
MRMIAQIACPCLEDADPPNLAADKARVLSQLRQDSAAERKSRL